MTARDWTWAAGWIVLASVVVFSRLRGRVERRERLKRVAAELGFDFQPVGQSFWPGRLSGLPALAEAVR
ncbi:MAG TPA: hypothetical protein VK576_05505, partial [Thermoleophilia bacterium]|nr:hypothetical protein [Thermoleophilia bacterium]